MRVKICGVTNVEDACLAADCGAWAVGLVFFEESPRLCNLEEAAAIGAELKRRCEVTGVFVNATLDEITRTADQCQLGMLQLHGDEGPAFCAEARRRTGAKVIKAARVKNRSSIAALSAYSTDYFMLDSYSDGVRGGSGETFDWASTVKARPRAPLILSGGLTPDNVAEGIAAVRPFAVDVASGVEKAPGLKDHSKVRAFFRAVEATREQSDPKEPDEQSRTEVST